MISFVKLTAIVTVFILPVCGDALACPTKVEIIQDGTVKKFVEPVRTNQSVVEFYNYHDQGEPLRSGTPNLPLAPRRSVVAIHQNAATCETSLVIIHSSPGEGPLISYAEMYVSGDLHNPLVQDDPPFTSFMLFDDQYDSLYWRIPNMTRLQWYWFSSETDGIAHPIVSPDYAGCLTIIPDFTNTAPDANGFFFFDTFKFAKIEEWVFASEDGATTNLNPADPLFICFNGAEPPSNSSRTYEGDQAFPDSSTNCDSNEPVCDYCERLTICYWHWWCNFVRVINCGQNWFTIPQP